MEIDYTSFMEKNEDGTIKSFDGAKLESYVDSLISKGVDSYKLKVAKEKELSKMTEQEKYSQMAKDFEAKQLEWENKMKARERDLIVKESKSRLNGKFSEAEINLLIKNVTNDEKESLKYIDELVAERTKFLDESKKKIIEELQSNQPNGFSQANNEENVNHNKTVKVSSQSIKDYYK